MRLLLPFLSALAGLGFGRLYLSWLARAVAARPALAGFGLRIGAALVFFALLARLGASDLLAGFGGFLLARTVLLQRKAAP